jgi:conjugal transfer pilus assembly protein TraA
MKSLSLHSFTPSRKLNSAALFVALGMLAFGATAGTTGVEFQAFFTLIEGWVQGYLGKAIALGAFLIGAVVGVAKSTVMPALAGLAFALIFTVMPGVISGMMTATI